MLRKTVCTAMILTLVLALAAPVQAATAHKTPKTRTITYRGAEVQVPPGWVAMEASTASCSSVLPSRFILISDPQHSYCHELVPPKPGQTRTEVALEPYSKQLYSGIGTPVAINGIETREYPRATPKALNVTADGVLILVPSLGLTIRAYRSGSLKVIDTLRSSSTK